MRGVLAATFRRRPWLPAGLRTAQLVTGALVVAYLASTLFRSRQSSNTFFDVWVANVGYAGCTALVGWRAIAVRRARLAWAAMAAALLVFTCGSVLWTALVQYFNPLPYPSVSDGFFLTYFPFAFLGIGLLVRQSIPKTARTIWLDGLIAGLGVAAIEATLVIGSIAHGNKGDFGTVATNIAYPIGDLMLVSMVVVVFAVRGWRPGRMWWMLGAGLAIFAAADSIYVLRVTSGTYVTGTPLDSLWLIGAYVMAAAAWQGLGIKRRTAAAIQPPITVPALFLLSSLGIVLYATTQDVLPLGVVLATITLLLAFGRSAHAFRQLRVLADSKREARTDELTGLPNRRLFYERLGACLEHGSTPDRLAVLMIDLDRFKEINDSLGHHVGDDVLRQLGPRLIEAAGSMGTVARLGGDEFGLLISPLVGPSMATQVAESVRATLRLPFQLESMSLRVDASIGIAIAPDHGTDPETLLQKADLAMYAAKHDRKPWQIYSSEHDQNTRERLELMEDLRDAIERGEIVMYYQPKVDLSCGTVRGVEALARWRHPHRGILEPAKFLGLVETGGLMGPFTLAVLDSALIQQAQWVREGYDLGVAVNLSAANLRDEDLPGKVASLMSQRSVRPSRVTLEITEDSFIADPVQAMRVLNELGALGVEISIDDYGTGFSSLSYLLRLPVSELKLDRTFLTGVLQDERAVSVIRSTVDLAHSLGLRVVAEGVEDLDSLTLITGLGCDVAQGYLLGRPVPAEDLFAAPRDGGFLAVKAGAVKPLPANREFRHARVA